MQHDQQAQTSAVTTRSGATGLIRNPSIADSEKSRLAILDSLRENPARPNATPILRGVPLFEAAGDEQLTTADLAYFQGAATANWGIDFTAAGSHENRRCFLVWKQAQSEGYGAAEFRHAVDQFIARTQFATWVIEDFFRRKRPRVYGHAWFRENWSKHGAEGVGTYEVEVAGKKRPVWGLRSECDGLLPEWESEHVPEDVPTGPAELPAAAGKDFMSPDTRRKYTKIMAELRKGIELDAREIERQMARGIANG